MAPALDPPPNPGMPAPRLRAEVWPNALGCGVDPTGLGKSWFTGVEPVGEDEARRVW
jgi:hypothetical protein